MMIYDTNAHVPPNMRVTRTATLRSLTREARTHTVTRTNTFASVWMCSDNRSEGVCSLPLDAR